MLELIEKQPLSKSLPTTLKIAIANEDEDLIKWINLELAGYFSDNPAMNEETVVPTYRTVPGQWYDNFEQQLIINDHSLAFINEIRLREGVSELEGIAFGTEMLTIRPLEFTELIHKHLNVDVAVFRFKPSSVNQVLMNIKVQLIDKLANRGDLFRENSYKYLSQKPEIIELKPGFFGISVNLKALWQYLFSLNI